MLVGELVEGAFEALDLADPLCFFERGPEPARPVPPFFLPVGTKDPLLDDTRRLARALRAMGVSAEEEYYPGEIHAFHAFVMRAAARKCWGDTFAFLARHGANHERLPGEINFRVTDLPSVVKRVETALAPDSRSTDRTDGLSLDFGDWRMNLRASNTEPVLRLNVEARGDAGLVTEGVARVTALIEG